LQFVRGTYSTATNHTSAVTWSATGLSTSITPASTSSKIIILVNQPVCNAPESTGGIRIMRGSTVLYSPGNSVFGLLVSSGNGYPSDMASIQYIDEPATTSPVTYSTQGISGYSGASTRFYSNASYDLDVGVINALSQIYLIEIS
jgi:hypothetical protein